MGAAVVLLALALLACAVTVWSLRLQSRASTAMADTELREQAGQGLLDGRSGRAWRSWLLFSPWHINRYWRHLRERSR